jgi:hypothetical protein
MKIISKFKDYYDWVAQRYGGGDPLNTWSRLDFLVRHYHGESVFDTPETTYHGVVNHSWGTPTDNYGWNLTFCVLNGRPYPLVNYWETDRLGITHVQPKRLLREGDAFLDFYRQTRGHHTKKEEQIQSWLNPKESHLLLKVSRELQQPAFIIRGRELIEGKLPRLGELGFAALFSAEQMYQNLSYFVGNYLRESADLKPPVTISDRDRILQHGFDLKKSFRR